MIGTWQVKVHAARPFAIHGDMYFELHVTRLDHPSQELLAIRVPQHALPGVPRPGDDLAVSFLMGQVTEARRINPNDQAAPGNPND
jgi:hypothetical protein